MLAKALHSVKTLPVLKGGSRYDDGPLRFPGLSFIRQPPWQDPYGRITGRIADSAGAVIPGAGIRVTNIETNVAVNAASDSRGNYEARNLIPGQYRIVVEMKGFKRYQRGPLEVRVGDVLAVDVGLELGV